jgi:hypothetical protein
MKKTGTIVERDLLQKQLSFKELSVLLPISSWSSILCLSHQSEMTPGLNVFAGQPCYFK